MKKIFLSVLFISFLSLKLFAQTLTVSNTLLNFGTATEVVPDSLQLTIFNNIGHVVNVTGIKFYNTYASPAFSARENNFSIADGSSKTIWIKFLPQHNIFHNSELVIENDGLRGYVSVDLNAQGNYSKVYYNATQNLAEENLKTSIKSITGAGYNSLGYDNARDYMFMQIDNKKVNGQGASQNTLECIYTGRLAVGYTSRTDCQTNDQFNTEHTYPQGFFASAEPMLSDLHHLFPTDDAANNKRASNPFGEVTSPNWSVGGSIATNSLFEPRDVQKGATARAMMYFVLRYSNYSNFFTSQENVLKTWNKNFLSSTIEKKRNDDIYSLQKNRNPFVDYPQLADRITSFVSTSVAPVVRSIDLTQDTIQYGVVQMSVNNIFNYVIVNNGNTNVVFNNFSLSHPGKLSFQSGGTNTSLAPGEALKVQIKLITATNDSIHGWLNFNTDVPGKTSVAIPVRANDAFFNDVEEISAENILIYPNPVSKQLKIENGKWKMDSIELFNSLGESLLKSEIRNVKSEINFENFSPGIYFLKIVSGEKIFFTKIVKE